MSCKDTFSCSLLRMTDELSTRGWAAVVASWLMVLVFGMTSIMTVWWSCNFISDDDGDDHCHEAFISIRIESVGACIVGESAGTSEQDCIHWADSDKWEALDRQSGNDTDNVKDLFNMVHGIAVGICGLAGLCAVIALGAPFSTRFKSDIQYILFFCASLSTLGFILMIISVPSTDAVRLDTWSYLSDCPERLAFPVTGWYSSACGLSVSGFLAFYTLFPGRLPCFRCAVESIPLKTSEISISGPIADVDRVSSAPGGGKESDVVDASEIIYDDPAAVDIENTKQTNML